MDHLSCKEDLAEAIRNGNVYDFKQTLKTKLKQVATRKIGLVVEETAPDANPYIVITSAAKSFGGYDSVEEDGGVIGIYFRSKQSTEDFANYLEQSEFVESYEINASWQNRTKDQTQTVIDLETITDDRAYNFEVIIYLYPEYSLFYDEADDSDTGGDFDDIDDSVYENYEFVPGEPIHEVLRKIKINSRNARRIKMQCGRGFKWDPSIAACVKIGGSELASMRIRSRHAVLTKRAEGAAFAVRVKRRTLKAFKFRKMAGLGI